MREKISVRGRKNKGQVRDEDMMWRKGVGRKQVKDEKGGGRKRGRERGKEGGVGERVRTCPLGKSNYR